MRWVDKDDYSTAKARLTARGYEEELTGQENSYSATPQPATLRLLLVANSLGLAVAVRACQAPILEKNDVWVTPASDSAVEPGRAWLLLKTLPGLKGRPPSWGSPRDEGQGRAPRSGSEARDPCVHSHVRERVCTMRHMDDYVIVGPLDKAMELTEDMGRTMLLRDVQF